LLKHSVLNKNCPKTVYSLVLKEELLECWGRYFQSPVALCVIYIKVSKYRKEFKASRLNLQLILKPLPQTTLILNLNAS